MKRYLLLVVLLLLAACAPQSEMAEQSESAGAAQGQVNIQINPPTETAVDEKATAPNEELDAAGEGEVPLTPRDPKGYDIDPYSTLGCQNLMTVEEFSSICEKENVGVTFKPGTKNCYVALKDKEDSRLTAEVSLTSYRSAEDAMAEFERRADIYNVNADTSVGEKSYTFQKLDRETLTFVKGEFFVDVGADKRLCSVEQVKQLSQAVAAKLN